MAKRRQRKRKRSEHKRRGGVMTGMRGGFKNIASSVSGAEQTSKKSSMWGSVITFVLLGLAALFLYKRFG